MKIEEMERELRALKSMMERTMIAVARMAGDIAEMKQVMATKMATKDDISSLNARMDGFSGLLQDSRLRWAVHSDTLSEHDKRLKKLEA